MRLILAMQYSGPKIVRIEALQLKLRRCDHRRAPRIAAERKT
jgi:hypothetical protein